MLYYINSILGILGTGVGVYYGYNYVKSYLNRYILTKVMEELDKRQEKEGIVFKHLEKTKSAVIVYKHGGKQHKVCVPYDRTKSRTMLRKKVFLVKAGEKIEITHKPGVPYLLSSKDMGGEKILVTKDNQTIKEYSNEEIPKYLN